MVDLPAPAPAGSAIPPKAAETLHRALGALGLTPYQARVQVALLQSGPVSCVDIARVSGVPRTSIYQILEELGTKGLASRLPGGGPAVWTSVDRHDVLAHLVALEEERLVEMKDRAARVAELLDQLVPEKPAPSLPYVNIIHDPSRVKPLYEQLLAQTEQELLVFNRPPYAMGSGKPQKILLNTVARVDTRVLYQAAEAEGPELDAWHHEMATYHDSGAEGRVVEELPIKLAIFDRQIALLSLDDPILPQVGFPISMLIEHPGYASVQAQAFENLWAPATPYDDVVGGRSRWSRSQLA